MSGRGKPFTKGNALGRGRPSIPLELKSVKNLTDDTYRKVFSRLVELPLDELEARIEDKKLPALEHILATAIHSAIVSGDIVKLNNPFDRVLGKVSDKVEVTMPKPTIIQRRDGTQVVLGAEMPEKEDDK